MWIYNDNVCGSKLLILCFEFEFRLGIYLIFIYNYCSDILK